MTALCVHTRVFANNLDAARLCAQYFTRDALIVKVLDAGPKVEVEGVQVCLPALYVTLCFQNSRESTLVQVRIKIPSLYYLHSSRTSYFSALMAYSMTDDRYMNVAVPCTLTMHILIALTCSNCRIAELLLWEGIVCAL